MLFHGCLVDASIIDNDDVLGIDTDLMLYIIDNLVYIPLPKKERHLGI